MTHSSRDLGDPALLIASSVGGGAAAVIARPGRAFMQGVAAPAIAGAPLTRGRRL